MKIKETLQLLPALPGVYIFKDIHNAVIYIGKARSLKTRVRSYFKKTFSLDPRIETLRDDINQIEYIPTKNETEALLLEAELVKNFQPKYNILLKDGQPLLYLVITNDLLPEFKIVRNKNIQGTYFGPFIKKIPVRKIHSFLSKTFRLKLCNKKIAHGCLQYHMGNCVGACKADFDREEYFFRLELVKKILAGNYEQFSASLENKIKEYNKQLAFEKSHKLHQYIENLDHIIQTVKLHFSVQKYAPFIELATLQDSFIPDAATAGTIKNFLGLERDAHVIDCFDISHTQGQHMVGSCVRFHDGIPIKNKFRRFKIKTLDQQNDYAALAEIVSRRYKRKIDYPDLMIIDGGKGQLHAIEQLNFPIECASIAKREERVFSKKYPQGKLLDIHSDIGKLIIRLRDYAHHFAISYHRKKRSMSTRR
jgi:excinuclease ABC subunit C